MPRPSGRSPRKKRHEDPEETDSFRRPAEAGDSTSPPAATPRSERHAKPRRTLSGRRAAIAEQAVPKGLLASDDSRQAARKIVAELRDSCMSCSYRRVCAFAPVALAADLGAGRRERHPHSSVLKDALGRLAAEERDWQRGLLEPMAGREKDGLFAGCMLATGLRRSPAPMAELLRSAEERLGEARERAGDRALDPPLILAREMRGQVLRAAAFLQGEETDRLLREHLTFEPDEERRLDRFEMAAALRLLLTERRTAGEWAASLEERGKETFRASFAVHGPDVPDLAPPPEGEAPPKGLEAEAFFPYRRGHRRTYLYLRRDCEGHASLASVDALPVADLLPRVFRVFRGDERKTWKTFKEVLRHVNVRAGRYPAEGVLHAFERLAREDLLLLGLYAPALARAAGSVLRLPEYDRFVKLLYRCQRESGRRGGPTVSAHEKVFAAREELAGVRAALGDDAMKEVLKLVFRLNANYRKAAHTSDTYYKLGEVAYLLTALAGWNKKGLEVELKAGKKPLALIAFGMQPACEEPQERYRALHQARIRHRGNDEMLAAIEAGMRALASQHGEDDPDAFARRMKERLAERPAPASAPAREPAAAEPPPAGSSTPRRTSSRRSR